MTTICGAGVRLLVYSFIFLLALIVVVMSSDESGLQRGVAAAIGSGGGFYPSEWEQEREQKRVLGRIKLYKELLKRYVQVMQQLPNREKKYDDRRVLAFGAHGENFK